MMNLKINYLCVRTFLLFTLFLQMPTLMAETFLMSDDIIRTKIALHHLNKIGIKNDKIASVSGNDGTYFFEKNEKCGFGFIKPSLENGNNPISLNITTASGKTQGLLLDIEDCNPQTIELQSDKKDVFTDIGNYESELPADNSNNDYESSVIEAMKSFVIGKNSEPTLGLQKLDLENEPKRNVNGFKIEFLETYRVGSFVGYKFKVTTEIDASFEPGATLPLQESKFSQKGDIALSFSKLVISKNKPVFLYILRRT